MIRKHPIYVVRSSEGGCGHQHSRPSSAMNCGLNVLQRYPQVSYFDVVQVTRKGDDTEEKLISRETRKEVLGE